MKKPSTPKTLEEAIQVINQLWAVIEQLIEQRDTDSSNSSKPPSSDGFKSAKRRAKPRSKRSQGAQPGHPKHERRLFPESEVDSIQRYFPPSHCACGQALDIDSTPSTRHQIFDVPPVTACFTEHQLFRGHCRGCGKYTAATFPQELQSKQMGPNLISWIGILAGQCHMSMRQIQCFLMMQWQLHFSLGAISQAQDQVAQSIAPVYQQIGQHLRSQDILYADETQHKRNSETRWLWTLTNGIACYFLTHYSRGKDAANEVLGQFDGYLVTDNYGGYNDYPRDKRQLCFAHLIRHARWISERRGRAGLLGKKLLVYCQAVIRTRHRLSTNTLTQEHYRRRQNRLRKSIHEVLVNGSRLRTAKRVANKCKHWLKNESMIWTFLQDERIGLTNNTAERAIRPYVIWRKQSYAVQSSQGDRFRPSILTLVETAKRLQINAQVFLTEACKEFLSNRNITGRLPLEGALPANQ